MKPQTLLRWRSAILWLCLVFFGAQAAVQQLHVLQHLHGLGGIRVAGVQVSAAKTPKPGQEHDESDCALCWSIAGLSQALPMAVVVIVLLALALAHAKALLSLLPVSNVRLALSLRGPPRFV